MMTKVFERIFTDNSQYADYEEIPYLDALGQDRFLNGGGGAGTVTPSGGGGGGDDGGDDGDDDGGDDGDGD